MPLELPKYEPTPEEIRAECLKIQDGWDEQERWNRTAPAYRSKSPRLRVVTLDSSIPVSVQDFQFDEDYEREVA